MKARTYVYHGDAWCQESLVIRCTQQYLGNLLQSPHLLATAAVHELVTQTLFVAIAQVGNVIRKTILQTTIS
jgi:hypothetical protein